MSLDSIQQNLCCVVNSSIYSTDSTEFWLGYTRQIICDNHQSNLDTSFKIFKETNRHTHKKIRQLWCYFIYNATNTNFFHFLIYLVDCDQLKNRPDGIILFTLKFIAQFFGKRYQ